MKAICLKTYPDEDDMYRCVQGQIEPCDVKVNIKGDVSDVNPEYYNSEYWEIIKL